MAIDSDDDFSLPRPPPPRPAARRDAIETAVRKFDGIEEPKVQSYPQRTGWAVRHQRQLGGLVAAALIVMVSVPVALTVLRQNPPDAIPRTESTKVDQQEPVDEKPQAHSAPESAVPSTAEGDVPQDRTGVAEIPAPAQPQAAARRADRKTIVADETKAAQAPAAIAAAPSPPPPPPPPAPTRDRSEQYAEQAASQDMVVTGSRIPSANLSKQGELRAVAEQEAEAADLSRPNTAYRAFLSRLQSAVRAKDRRAIVNLIDLPLRVNFNDGAHTYRDRRSIERDFERIFTPAVRKAILGQRAERLFTNTQGAMVGDGQVWFDQTCPNDACSPPGPVRIKAINP
jgi:hypothetical protein